MKATKTDIIWPILLSILWTVFMGAVTIGMAYISGIDPRNNLFGELLPAIGVLVIPVFGWPAGLYHIWMQY